MLKITTTLSGDAVTIAIAGRLTQDGCRTLDRILSEARERTRHVRIDLSGIRLVDRPSIEYLAAIRCRDVALVNPPCYILRWVDRVSGQNQPAPFARPI